MDNKLEPIHIKHSPSADSKSAKTPPTPEVLTVSTQMHINDVKAAMASIANALVKRASLHDHTKLEHIEDFCDALNSGHIKDTDWYKMHITEERHHLKSNVPNDVNLLDVFEHICDCVMAGMARSGEVYDIDLSPDVLTLALRNTVEMLKAATTMDVENEDEYDDPMQTEIGD